MDMKLSLSTVLLALTTSAFANNVIVNGTRFIYPGDSKEISIQYTNQATTPAVIQTWLDTGDPDASPDDITTPFSITPPIVKIEGKSGQTLRVRAVNKIDIPQDRESIWWLNTLEVPPIVNVEEQEDMNILQLAIRSRFKFLYRPSGLGQAIKAPEKLVLTVNGSELNIENSTPFYITISKVENSKKVKINKVTVMIQPKGSVVMKLTSSIHTGDILNVVTINDYSADAKYKLKVQ